MDVREIDKKVLDNMEYHAAKSKYYNYVANADMSQYDSKFVNLYRDGKIVIRGHSYNVKDLYIETGLENNQSKKLLVYYKEPNVDILTKEIKRNFSRTDLFLFYNSTCFYQIYSIYKDKVQDNILTIPDSDIEKMKNLIYSFNGAFHNATPETVYINSNQKKTI